MLQKIVVIIVVVKQYIVLGVISHDIPSRVVLVRLTNMKH
jgi:hypothetical protein